MPAHDSHTLTPRDAMLHELYLGTMAGSDAQSTAAGPLASHPAPHLDVVYDAISDALDIPNAFAARYRSELHERIDRPLPLTSIAGKSALVSALIYENYPPSMRHFADENDIAQNLQNPTAARFSFAVLGQEQGKPAQYQAVCTAYVADSKVAPGNREVLYIDDLVVGLDGQRKQLGILAFREVLTRAKVHNQEIIEMRTRRRTSHKGFRGPVMARILHSMGYQSTDHGVVAQYGTDEDTEYSHLIEVVRVSSQ
ncbi:MAG TPA: hypothetical protein VLF59_04675 [Candidatus Saccharimonadales bacterium]|nr:hypothetical protein [Candidatus Saccharimonadales bacterium]